MKSKWIEEGIHTNINKKKAGITVNSKQSRFQNKKRYQG